MKFFPAFSTNVAAAAAAAASLLLLNQAFACNPLKESGCAPNKALGGTVNVDFTKGASDQFTASYNIITYESDGMHLTVAQKGDAPLLVSNWYIMFGRFEIVFKSAPGQGMISSAILQSDSLDEIDWELLGADPTEAQTNYFGRGVTETYDREVTVADPTATTAFSTYVIDWNEERIIWSINGVTLRTLYAANADIDSSGKSEYPQSPMQIKIGPWAGGDPSNPEGTITWAGGEINYANGPYTMVIQSLSVTDYSTGTEYEYTGTSGTYKDITAIGGAINGNANGATGNTITSTPSSTSASSAAASSTATSITTSPATSVATSTIVTSSSFVFASSQVDSTTSINTRTTWPWVPMSTTGSSAIVTTTPAVVTVTGSTSSSPATQSLSSDFFSVSLSSAAGSAGDKSLAPSAVMTAYTTLTTVAPYATTALVYHTTASAVSGSASSATSPSMTAYTGSATANGVAVVKVGVAVCIAAGLVLGV